MCKEMDYLDLLAKSQCKKCKHFNDPNAQPEIKSTGLDYCSAFFGNDGIPDEIFTEGHDRPRPDLGQKNDIVFTPKEPEKDDTQ